MTKTGTVDALQLALAAEHAAVFGYGVVGARGVAADADLALESYAMHRRRRDELTAQVRSAGGDPIAAEAGYRLPGLHAPGATSRMAAGIEKRCARVYAYVVANTTDDSRLYAAHGLVDCAVRGVRWGAGSDPFPGLTGR